MTENAPRILVVDDEPALCELLAKFLTRWGYLPECATSGAAALGILRARKCDLALIDLMMPGMNGQELAPHIKRFNREIPVIMISAFPPAQVEGVDRIFSKPLAPAKLKEIIESSLGLNRPELGAAG
ncbi:MAG TPA: response regulator [Candidatus Saccharimonadales bacterium]|nr:response regulator [Candidatus Saccharimonadales bacterium]